MNSQVHELLLVVFGLVLILLVQESLVEVASVGPLLFSFESERDVQNVNYEAADVFAFVVQLHLDHEHEFVEVEGLSLCHQIVQLLQ